MMPMRLTGLMVVGGVVVASASPERMSVALRGTGEPTAETRIEQLEQTVDLLTKQLRSLEVRLTTAERKDRTSATSNKVQAPFEVVGPNGKTLFRVDRNPQGGGAVTVHDPSATPLAWISALPDGAFFKARASGGTYPEIVLGTHGTVGGLAIRDEETKARVEMLLNNRGPWISLYNRSHQAVVNISHGDAGGWIQLVDGNGVGQVWSGVQNGCGKVETYPEKPRGAAAVGHYASKLAAKGCD